MHSNRIRLPQITLRALAVLALAAPAALASAASASPPAAGDPAPAHATAVAAPDWAQLHHGPDRTGYQPDETRVTTSTAARLGEVRRYVTGTGGNQPPLVADGVLYTIGTGRLQAFDATGRVGCAGSPVVCSPLWSVPGSFTGLTVGGGRVVATVAAGAAGVYVYDAAACRTSPSTCAPLWSTSAGPRFLPGPGSPLVVGSTLYVPGSGASGTTALAAGGAYVAAFDLLGVSGCSGSPVVCAPMWTTTGPAGSRGNAGSPAVVGNRLYLANEALFSFAADGTTGCTGSPRVCAPLWTGVLPATSTGYAVSAPAVSGGTVFVPLDNGPLQAFDAAGRTGCTVTGGVRTCQPLWTSTLQSGRGTPAVAGGVVYAVSGGRSPLQAYDAAGVTGCSGAAGARTCAPLWMSSPGSILNFLSSSSPAVAGGVVYVEVDGGTISGYDARGRRGCASGGGTVLCSPLWSTVTGEVLGDALEMTGGVLVANLSLVGYLLAYGLPPASPTTVGAVPGAAGRLVVHLVPGDDDGSPVTATTATCTSSSGGVPGKGSGRGSVTTVTVSGLTSGASYTCTAAQKNPAGASRPSAPSAPVVVP